MVRFIESEVFSQESEDPLDLPVPVHFVVALLQNGGVAGRLKP